MNKHLIFATKMLEVLGVLDNGTNSTLRLIKIIILIIFMLMLFLSGVNELAHTSNDFSHFNDIMSAAFIGGIGLVKYVFLIYYSRRIMNLMEKINDAEINGDISHGDNSVIERYDEIGSHFSKFITGLVIFVGIGISTQNMPDFLLRNDLHPPIHLSNTINLDSFGCLILIYIQQLVSIVIFGFAFVANNAWAIFLCHHACGHMCVLQNYFERIAEDEEWTEYQPMDTCRKIAKCVKLHQNICRLTDELEQFFVVPNFIHFLISAVGICTSTYELCSGDLGVELVAKHVTAVCGQLVQLFIVNWCGQIVQDKSIGLSSAIYRSNFYKLEPRHQKDLTFILLKTQKPIYLTAGKFYILSLDSFANVLKGAVSTFAMFTNVGESQI